MFKLFLFFITFASASSQEIIRNGYVYYDSNKQFQGILLDDAKKLKSRKFKAYFYNSDRNSILLKPIFLTTSKQNKIDLPKHLFNQNTFLYLKPIESDRKITNYYSSIVFEKDFNIENLSFMNKAKQLDQTSQRKVETLLEAKYKQTFFNMYNFEKLVFDSPFFSPIYETDTFVIIASYFLKEGVDYGYGYYVPQSIDQKNLGTYIYDKETKILTKLIANHLPDAHQLPITFKSNGTNYYYFYISVGKTYGHYRCYKYKDGNLHLLSSSSNTGS